MRILVLGATGMLGHAVFRVFSADAGHETWGSMRSAAGLRHFPAAAHARLLSGVDVLDQDALLAVMARVKPEVVINCVGLIKQLADAGDPLTALPINAMLPRGWPACARWRGAPDSCQHRLRFPGAKDVRGKRVSDAEDPTANRNTSANCLMRRMPSPCAPRSSGTSSTPAMPW